MLSLCNLRIQLLSWVTYSSLISARVSQSSTTKNIVENKVEILRLNLKFYFEKNVDGDYRGFKTN